MQGTLVQFLVWEDPTCCATAVCAPQLLSVHSRALELQLLKPSYLETEFGNKRSHRNEKTAHRNEE